ncbi:hypothetical protein L3Y34_011293 [Caenorhabditis briggsae]|uniref:Uncharacterized protein n=1 Tax=Caenorhabditis briggsae TaxID=6238 RepID=A0AAE8ZSI6_CAEBR|nr:hypothetical protein L3Y34_011293 [Caenorhabditis briggsae]
MCPKEVFEAGVTLDVRTSKASIPQESTVRSENPIIFENQAHQDNVKYPLVEDEAPDESAGSETVESEISTTISLIKNSASASTEKTIPENPRTMEALTIPDASRIICSADMGGSEEDTIALAKQDLLILQNHKIQTSTLLCNGKWEDYRRCMKKCTKIHFVGVFVPAQMITSRLVAMASETTPEVSTSMVQSSSASAPKTIDASLAPNFPIVPMQGFIDQSNNL